MQIFTILACFTLIESASPEVKESSINLLLPLILLSFLAIFSGYFFKELFISDEYSRLWISSNVINLFNQSFHHKNYLINFIPTTLATLGILTVLYLYFFNQNIISFLKKKFQRVYNLAFNKFFFDEIYNYLLVNSIIKLSDNLWKKIDIGLIDRIGPDGLAASTKRLSKFFSKLQTGYIYHYALSFIIGMALLITFIIFFF